MSEILELKTAVETLTATVKNYCALPQKDIHDLICTNQRLAGNISYENRYNELKKKYVVLTTQIDFCREENKLLHKRVEYAELGEQCRIQESKKLRNQIRELKKQVAEYKSKSKEAKDGRDKQTVQRDSEGTGSQGRGATGV